MTNIHRVLYHRELYQMLLDQHVRFARKWAWLITAEKFSVNVTDLEDAALCRMMQSRMLADAAFIVLWDVALDHAEWQHEVL